MEEHRKRVIQYEDKLLEAIGFHFSVAHAHRALLELGVLLRVSKETVGAAFAYLQRLYATSIILHYPPHYLALAAVVEARRALGKSVDFELRWAQREAIAHADLAAIAAKLAACAAALPPAK